MTKIAKWVIWVWLVLGVGPLIGNHFWTKIEGVLLATAGILWIYGLIAIVACFPRGSNSLIDDLAGREPE